LRFAPLVLLIAVLAGCASKPSCDATSCQAGCCDANSVCSAGDTLDACGKAGSGACAVCAADQQCVLHACKVGASGGGSAGAGGGQAGMGGGSGGGGVGHD